MYPDASWSPLHRDFQLVIALDDFLAALEEHFALWRQLPWALRAVDQLGPEATLDLLDRLAGR